jgi:hypothetical protein
MGVATGAYAADNQDLIWSFSWKGGESYLMMDINGDLVETQMPADDIGAAARQAVHILRLNGGRVGPNGMPIINGWIPHALYTHLVLQSYQDEPLPSRWVVSPADSVRLDWQDDPVNKFDQGFWLPLQPDPTPTNKRWPYSASYSVTASAWDYNQSSLGDEFDAKRTYQSFQHNFWVIPAETDVSQRPIADVAFPDAKVHVHDTHQRHLGDRRPYYGLEEARIPLLMFDGAAAVRQTADANPGWRPPTPDFPCSVFNYKPSAWEPDTVSGDAQDVVKGYYRWTRGGLLGRDFGALPLDTGQADPGECDL